MAVLLEGDFSVHLERTGGFTGIPVNITINSIKITRAQVEEIRQLIIDSRLIGMEDSLSDKGYPDQFYYAFTIKQQKGVHEVKIDEKNISPVIRKLINRVTEIARSQR